MVRGDERPGVILRTAELADLPELAVFARRIFDETFSPDNPVEVMIPYMDEAFTTERITAEWNEPQSVYWLARIDGDLAGYARVRRNLESDHELGTNNLELQRLYVDARWHGNGVAQKLMEAVITHARNCDWLWLGVWEKNPRAIRFYEKWGFETFGTHEFLMGTDRQTDLVMRRKMQR